MATLLLGAPKGDNKIYRLDDPALTTDEGAAFPARFQVADVDFGPAGGEGRLRRVAQAVALGGNCTITITPVANGGEVADQAESQALVTSAGAEQIVESYPASLANRHAIVIEATNVLGPVALGECDLHLVPSQSRSRVA
jgi:hypothetical protein